MTETRRYAAGIEYLGSRYHGWQTQAAGVDTVQARLTGALSQVAGHEITLVCAGRTDAGVHARGQVVHFDSRVERSPKAWVFGANAHLPEDVCLRWAQPVAPEFHARYSALSRTYLYLINNQRVPSALLSGRTTREHRALNAARMHAAGQYLLGERDFTSFRASGCQSRTPMREITQLSVERRGDLLLLRVTANAFLHHMVRNIVGVLLEIGAGVFPPQHAARVLVAKDRTKAARTAPPEGLYLEAVSYPEVYGLPAMRPPADPLALGVL